MSFVGLVIAVVDVVTNERSTNTLLVIAAPETAARRVHSSVLGDHGLLTARPVICHTQLVDVKPWFRVKIKLF